MIPLKALMTILCLLLLHTSPSNETVDYCTKETGCDEGTVKYVSAPGEIDVIFTFTNAFDNTNLQNKLKISLCSLIFHSSTYLKIHIIGDEKSQNIASNIAYECNLNKSTYEMVKIDIDSLTKNLFEVIEPMQKHFSSKPDSYYGQSLFFLSIAIHRVMPMVMEKVIMLDADIKFKTDITELHHHFNQFSDDNILGIANDLQPVYRHTFWKYRKNNPGTRVGEPSPDGLPGYNSGVMLLDLNKMRSSELYNSLLQGEKLQNLIEEFHFQGHLGDQDFFTLIGMKYEELIYVLPCEWNRQLCTWWKNKGYESVFDKYFECLPDINIYHGNCNTPIPDN